jgi:AcrR family transcriptional regulator
MVKRSDAMPDKEDRRVQRTRQLLKDALVALIEQKGYEAVTVQDILDRANLGRSTFYAHYTDKDALLFSTFEQLQGAFDAHTRQLSDGKVSWTGEGLDLSLALFRYVENNRKLFKTLFLGQSGDMLRKHVYDYLSTHMRKHLKLAVPAAQLKSPQAEVAVHFLISTFVALLTWWLDKDLTYTAAEMDDLFKKLALPGFVAVMGMMNLEAAS